MTRPTVWPAPHARLAQRPLPAGAVTVTGGPWQYRRRTNARVSLAHGLEQLRRSGTIANFARLGAGGSGDGGRHGHLDAFDPDTKNFVDSDVYKWLEAVAWARVAEQVPADVLEAADEIVELVGGAQAPDGYLNTWFQTLDPSERFSDLRYGHELYCLGHLIQAGLAWQRVRGDDRLLKTGRRFADLVVERFGDSDVVCGHPCVEMALMELTRETGEPQYARLAAAMIDRRGRGTLGAGRFGSAYYQDERPYREMRTLDGHAVRALYLAAGATDVATDNGDGDLLAAAWRQWEAVRRSRVYLTGGLGSRHLGESFGADYELPPDAAYCETCAAIGLVMWSWRLQLTRTDGAIGDLIERAVHNGLLSGVALGGRSFHYTNPLDVHDAHPRQEWFEIACCPPNVMRAIATLDQLVATETDDGVQLHQYVPARIDAGRGRVLTVETGYPADGTITVRVLAAPVQPWGMAVRVPAWSAQRFAVAVNGAPAPADVADGYAKVRRVWREGDAMTLTLDLAVRTVRADPRISAARGTVAVERGPIVYALDAAVAGGGDPAFVRLQEDLDAQPVPSAVPGLVDLDVAVLRERLRDAGWPYLDTADPVAGVAARVRLVPFAHAGNAGAGPLRTWLGATPAGG
ncbi:glycoside hydrolase family 127 protein [Jiangella ureilytica]|uniref:Glycoside hydrolase family 127 protein n=1 Tax=Jiangella ureilytica TaxID=2530374 RepID=A0A4R4RHW4_9ACTN|nr:beta-L-arabinofuranosidase domain-containing protein [Jiangella ureilytica]TDC48043.1 glycoside hydrolase family 127 protein [Jiangella ureilytica]